MTVRRVHLLWSASFALSSAMIAVGVYLSVSTQFVLRFKGISPKPGPFFIAAGLVLILLTALHLRRHR